MFYHAKVANSSIGECLVYMLHIIPQVIERNKNGYVLVVTASTFC